MLSKILGALLTHPSLMAIALIVVFLILVAVLADWGPEAEPGYEHTPIRGRAAPAVLAPVARENPQARERLIEYCALEAAKDQARAARLAAEQSESAPPAAVDLARELDIRASIARPYPTGALANALARRRASRRLAQQIAEERPREMAVGDFE